MTPGAQLIAGGPELRDAVKLWNARGNDDFKRDRSFELCEEKGAVRNSKSNPSQRWDE